MDKNVIKNIIDIIKLLLLISIIVLLNLEFKAIVLICLIILSILLIALVIIDLIYWRCPKCNRYLPQNSFFRYVLCCPYCGTNIEKNRKKKN